MNLTKIPYRRWPGCRVAVYGRTSRSKHTYLYDAHVLPREYPGYSDKTTRVIVKVITDNPLVIAKVINVESCEVLEES